jgi:hypothetical protein
MSLEATVWARHQRGLGAPARLVLLNLADKVPKGQCRAWPGVETVAEEEGLGETTVRRALRFLEEHKLVIEERRGGGFATTTIYRLALPNYPADAAGNYPADAANYPAAAANYPADAANYPAAAAPESTQRISRESTKATSPPPERVHAELLLPVPEPVGAAGELARGQYLDAVVAEVRARRQPPLTRPQAVEARRLARETLEAGWDARLVVAALVSTAAFTQPAFTFAADRLRREAVPDDKARLTKFEQAERRL